MLIDRHSDEIAKTFSLPVEQLRKTLVCIDISNVAAWFYEESPEEFDSYEDLPNLAPPWPHNWFEFALPNQLNLKGLVSQNHMKKFLKKVGVLREAEYLPEHGVFALRHLIFAETLYGFVPLGCIVFECDNNGKFINKGDKSVLYLPLQATLSFIKKLSDSGIYNAGVNYVELYYRLADSLLKVFYFANSLIHCKNVKLTESNIVKKLQTKKRKKKAFFHFNTIIIDAMQATLRSEGNSHKTGLKKALHICRGHFATYTAEAPLFGKITGTFWKPMHVRGHKQEGVVIKRYQIKAPNGPR